MLECRGPVTVEGSRWKTEAKGRLEKRAIVSSGKENGSEDHRPKEMWVAEQLQEALQENRSEKTVVGTEADHACGPRGRGNGGEGHLHLGSGAPLPGLSQAGHQRAGGGGGSLAPGKGDPEAGGAGSVAGKPRGHGSPVPRRPGTGGCSRGEHGDGRPGRLRQRLPLGTGALGSSGHPSGAARSARALRAGREQGAGPLRRAPPLRTRAWLWAPRPPTGPVGLLHHCFGPWTSPFLLMDPKCSCPKGEGPLELSPTDACFPGTGRDRGSLGLQKGVCGV